MSVLKIQKFLKCCPNLHKYTSNTRKFLNFGIFPERADTISDSLGTICIQTLYPNYLKFHEFHRYDGQSECLLWHKEKNTRVGAAASRRPNKDSVLYVL